MRCCDVEPEKNNCVFSRKKTISVGRRALSNSTSHHTSYYTCVFPSCSLWVLSCSSSEWIYSWVVLTGVRAASSLLSLMYIYRTLLECTLQKYSTARPTLPFVISPAPLSLYIHTYLSRDTFSRRRRHIMWADDDSSRRSVLRSFPRGMTTTTMMRSDDDAVSFKNPSYLPLGT